jgi:hypothetical protein
LIFSGIPRAKTPYVYSLIFDNYLFRLSRCIEHIQ